ncbi:hypothetical protein ACIXCC_11545 [Bacteroides fragilis]
MKVNFYQDITTGFEYLLQYLDDEKGDYLTGFKVVSFERPEKDDYSGWRKYNKHKSIYFCCLDKAGFKTNQKIELKISINEEIENILKKEEAEEILSKVVKTSNATNLEKLNIQEAYYFWSLMWKNKDGEEFKKKQKKIIVAKIG